MEVIFDFIVRYWEILSSLVLLLVSIILLIIKKKPISSISEMIHDWSILAIKEAEGILVDVPELTGAIGVKLPGEVKLARAVNFVLDCIKDKWPSIKDVNVYVPYIKEVIEDILSTPQKKERSKDEA